MNIIILQNLLIFPWHPQRSYGECSLKEWNKCLNSIAIIEDKFDKDLEPRCELTTIICMLFKNKSSSYTKIEPHIHMSRISNHSILSRSLSSRPIILDKLNKDVSWLARCSSIESSYGVTHTTNLGRKSILHSQQDYQLRTTSKATSKGWHT